MKKTIRYILSSPSARSSALDAVAKAPDGIWVELKEPTRTLAQNALMWEMLEDISNQKCWYGRFLTDKEWKHIFTATLKAEEVVPNLDGTGFIILGQHTSDMSVKQISDLIELMFAFGAQNKISFRHTARQHNDAR